MSEHALEFKVSKKDIQEFRGKLLDWYDKYRRPIPWRVNSGEKPNPYHVWLSEIMCQQTTVQAVIPYFLKFVERWPRVQDLANAEKEEVMDYWAGLGYYARARNLHACAQVVANDYGGVFPDTQDALKSLPGIGDYTSAAITTMAFQKPATVLDGNIERIMARIFSVEKPLPKSKPDLKRAAALFFEDMDERPGDFAQGLMDIGATICTPKSPKCMLCPVNDYCDAKAQGIAEQLPKKEKKKPKPSKSGYVYWITSDCGKRILLDRRPDNVMLGGTIGLPTSEWGSENDIHHEKYISELRSHKSSHITHSFTHFDLKLFLYTGKVFSDDLDDRYYWEDLETVKSKKLPTLFHKALRQLL